MLRLGHAHGYRGIHVVDRVKINDCVGNEERNQGVDMFRMFADEIVWNHLFCFFANFFPIERKDIFLL